MHGHATAAPKDDGAYVAGGYTLHSPDSRAEFSGVAVSTVAGALPLIGILAFHTKTFSVITAGLLVYIAALIVMYTKLPWRRLTPLQTVSLMMTPNPAFVLAAWHFNESDVLIGIFPMMIVFADALWFRPRLMFSMLIGYLGLYSVAAMLIDGTGELGRLVVEVPLMVAVAIALGYSSNQFVLMILRRKRSRATATSLLSALQARDGYTGEHSEETLTMARAVGAELGFDEALHRELSDVALLHDIGKIGIPNSILQKPGPLDDDEWKIMRQHPVIGEQILAEMPGFERVAKSIRHEHERWDGGGYPDGIAGEEIPIHSRIVLACDAYHAMTSDRPYRKRMSDEDARAELMRHAGSQFDPTVVEALLQALDSLAEAESGDFTDGEGADNIAELNVPAGPITDTQSEGGVGDALARLTHKSAPSLSDTSVSRLRAYRERMSDLPLIVNVSLVYTVVACIVLMTYLIGFAHVDTVGIAAVSCIAIFGASGLVAAGGGEEKLWVVATGIASYLIVPPLAYHFHEPALLMLLLVPATGLAAFTWESVAVLRALQALALFVVFVAAPVVMFGWSELARGLMGVRIAVTTIAVGFLASKMLKVQFDRKRFAETIGSLLAALQARDGYTGEHSEETLAMAMGVADRLELSPTERATLQDVALLHDIGKIGIPDEILNKPDRLTEDEWEVMRQHPVIGEQIVGEVPGFEDVAKAVRHEHERWDGGGYPDGIAGEEIPLASRIVLVCDAYHAMTSDRPYRSSIGVAAACEELVANAGTQFDPSVVAALLQEIGQLDYLDEQPQARRVAAA